MLRFIVVLFVLAGFVETARGQKPREYGGKPAAHWIENLSHTSATSRAKAATALAEIGDSAAVEPLLACLADADGDVRLSVAYALGKICQRPEECVEPLVRLLADRDEHVRYSAQWSLAQFADRLLQPAAKPNPLTQRLAQQLQAAAQTMAQQKAPEGIARRVKEAGEKLDSFVAPPAPQPVARTAPQPPASTPPAQGARAAFAPPSSTDGLLQLMRDLRSPDTFDQIKALERVPQLDPPSAALLLQALAGNLEDSVLSWKLPESLAKLGPPLVPALIQALAHGNEPARDLAIDVLTKMGPAASAAVPQITALIANDQLDEDLRQSLIGALGEIGPPAHAAVPALARLIAEKQQPDGIRTESARVLGLIGEQAKEAAPILADVVRRTDESIDLRRIVAQALVEITPDPSSTETLLESLMQNETEPELKSAFAEALCSIGSAAQPAVLNIAALVQQQGLDDHNRRDIIEALGQVGPRAEAATPLLLDLLKDSARPAYLHVAASQTLGKVNPRAAARAVADELTNADAAARITLARTLVSLGRQAEPALAHLRRMLTDQEEDCQVRTLAAIALGKIGAPAFGAAGELKTILQDRAEDDQLRAMCASSLGAIDLSSAAALAAALHDPCKRVQLTAAHTLYKANHKSGDLLQRILALLADEETADLAASALVDIGQDAIEPLVCAAHDKGREMPVRCRCIDLLGEIGLEAAPPLLTALADSEMEDSAFSALCTMGQDTVPILLVSAVDEKYYAPHARDRMREVVRDLHEGLGAGGDDSEWGPAHPLAPMPESTPLLGGGSGERIGPSGNGGSIGGIGRGYDSGFGSDPASGISGSAIGIGSGSGSGGYGSGGSGRYTPTPPTFTPNESATAETVRSIAPPRMAAPATAPPPGVPAAPVTTPAAPPTGYKSVKVFYGTNRKPLTNSQAVPTASQSAGPFSLRILLSLNAAAAVALATCLACLVWQRPRSKIAIIAAGLGLAVLVAPYMPVHALFRPRPDYQESYAYGGECSDTVELGVCNVTIPDTHRQGKLEAPSVFRLQFHEDPEKHIVLQSIRPLDQTTFFSELDGELAKKGKNILVFIHGYNVSFEDAARRTAQMALDLKFPGAPLLYSWPSQANWYHYRLDEKNVELSVTPLKEFLLEIAERCQASTINLVAHSMGNRALTSALKEIDASATQNGTLFNQVILAAPDIDANIFKQRIAPAIVTKAKHITLYASSKDLALFASRRFNSGDPRAGDAGDGLVIVPGIDTIDASAADSSLLGHTYYGDSVSIIRDIENLLQNQPARARPFLEPIAQSGLTYWLFQPPLTAAGPQSPDVMR